MVGMLDPARCRRAQISFRRQLGGAADQHAHFLPGFPHCCAGGSCEPGRQQLGRGFNHPRAPVRRVDGAAGKDLIDARHEPRRKRAAANQHFERSPRAAQQDKRGGVARPHRRFASSRQQPKFLDRRVVDRHTMRGFTRQ